MLNAARKEGEGAGAGPRGRSRCWSLLLGAAVVVSAEVWLSSTALSSLSAGVGAVQWTQSPYTQVGHICTHSSTTTAPACLPLYEMVICLPQIVGG